MLGLAGLPILLPPLFGPLYPMSCSLQHDYIVQIVLLLLALELENGSPKDEKYLYTLETEFLA